MTYDVLIIGGGIVGLATALQLQQPQPTLRIAVLEKEKALARHQTGHNSGVIHSGIYYKPGSLKALNCRQGYAQLLAFCDEEQIPYELCGKVIVATDAAEMPLLDSIYDRGLANGLHDIRKIGPEELRAREPHVQGVGAIWVPYSGIVDYMQVAHRYAERLVAAGGEVFLDEKVVDLRTASGPTEVVTHRQTYRARLVINCAGLFSDRVAALEQPAVDYRIIPFRGEYYELRPERQHLIRHLVYPVPDPNFPFLGVHFTRMIGGGIEAGPNAVFAFRREGYRRTDVHAGELWGSLAWPGFRKVAGRYWQTGLGELYRSFSKAAFTKALQKLVPELVVDDLVPGGAGVRAQACDRTGGLIDDFRILESPGFIHVGNAPSPAATASLAIGQAIAAKAVAHL